MSHSYRCADQVLTVTCRRHQPMRSDAAWGEGGNAGGTLTTVTVNKRNPKTIRLPDIISLGKRPREQTAASASCSTAQGPTYRRIRPVKVLRGHFPTANPSRAGGVTLRKRAALNAGPPPPSSAPVRQSALASPRSQILIDAGQQAERRITSAELLWHLHPGTPVVKREVKRPERESSAASDVYSFPHQTPPASFDRNQHPGCHHSLVGKLCCPK